MYKVLKCLGDHRKTNEEKTINVYEILGIPFKSDINKVLEYIFNSKFKNVGKGKKVFCYFQDFDLIYANILRLYKIDIIRDDLNWFEFNSMIEDIMMTENSLSKRVGYRAMKMPKATKYNKEEIEFYRDMKDKYRLGIKQNKEELNDGMRSIFNMLKGKAKKKGSD